MRNILALGLASFVAADDALLVDLTVDKAEVHRGESVRYTCNWDLSDTYGKLLFLKFFKKIFKQFR